MPGPLIPAEEMIWSKAFIMERERYDGADVAHILRACAEHARLAAAARAASARTGACCCSTSSCSASSTRRERARVPAAVMRELIGRLDAS